MIRTIAIQSWSNLCHGTRMWGTAILGTSMGLVMLVLLASGALSTPNATLNISLIAALFGAGCARRFIPPRTPHILATWLKQTDAVVLPLCGIVILSTSLGTHAEYAFPLVLIAVLWASASQSKITLWAALGFAVLTEFTLFLGSASWSNALPRLVLHTAFLGAFSMGGTYLLRYEILSARKKFLDELNADNANIAQDAKSLGLIADNAEEAQDIKSQIESVRTSFNRILRMAMSAVNADSVVLMTRTELGQMRVSQAFSHFQEALQTEPVPGNEGLLAVIGRQGLAGDDSDVLRICPLEGRTRQLPYYTHTPKEVDCVMAVPIRVGDQLMGIIFFDRNNGEGFSETAAEEARATATVLSRMLEVEQSLRQTDRRSEALEHLIDSSRTLTEAFGPDEVYQSVVTSASRFVPSRFVALLIKDATTGLPIVAHAWGDRSAEVMGQKITGDGALASLVFKTPATVPQSRQWSSQHGSLLGANLGPKLVDGEPVAVLALAVQKRTVGALVIVSHAPLDESAEGMIKLLADQAAFSIEHAQALKELRTRATTDALTAIDNRATVETKMKASLARCDRNGHEVAIVLVDIDHFKQVNDTRGHPVGDLVLRQVAKTLDSTKRVNDAVGRYGGEEFVLVLENTGDAGARLVAERVRQRIASLQFPSTKGPFKTTVSLGFSIFPRDGAAPDVLIKRADQALYQAKNNGRNLVRGFRDNLSASIGAEAPH